MASTINAAVGGVVVASDSSGALDIQAGGVNAIQVSSAANVTVPNLASTSAVITTLTATSANVTNLTATTLAATNFTATSLTVTNVIKVAQGGTGLSTTPTNGQLLIGNGTGFALSTLTAGSGITVTNNAGSITITNSSTGGAQDYIVQSYGIV